MLYHHQTRFIERKQYSLINSSIDFHTSFLKFVNNTDACTYIKHIHTHTNTNSLSYTHTHTHTHTHLCTQTPVHTHNHINTCSSLCVHAWTHTRAHTHTHTHTQLPFLCHKICPNQKCFCWVCSARVWLSQFHLLKQTIHCLFQFLLFPPLPQFAHQVTPWSQHSSCKHQHRETQINDQVMVKRLLSSSSGCHVTENHIHWSAIKDL